VSFAPVSPLHLIVHRANNKDLNSTQSNGCKLNFLNAIRGEVNSDVKARHALQINCNFVLPPSLESDLVIVSPPVEVFKEGCNL
jgi:hypothetical protein